MPFSVGEIANIAAASLDYYIKSPAFSQTIQDKPLLRAMLGKQKTFSGGKGAIDLPVKGDYTTAIQGYTHNDTVTFANPANLRRAKVPWKEVHAGIQVTLTELKIDGISVVDKNRMDKTTTHSEAEMHRLVGLLEDKLEDMAEGWSRSFNSMLWLDGTADPKLAAGVKAFITDTVATGTIAGLDRATATWWRNRTAVGGSAITPSTSLQTLTKFLRKEVRQLKRYGGKPDLVLAGSAFIEALEAEVFEKGTYTQEGFINRGKTDIGMADIAMRGVGTIMYDPTLDDIGESKRCYFIDSENLRLYVMDGEDRKTHNPAPPHDQYVVYRSMTWTGAVVPRQLNGCGVYAIV